MSLASSLLSPNLKEKLVGETTRSLKFAKPPEFTVPPPPLPHFVDPLAAVPDLDLGGHGGCSPACSVEAASAVSTTTEADKVVISFFSRLSFSSSVTLLLSNAKWIAFFSDADQQWFDAPFLLPDSGMHSAHGPFHGCSLLTSMLHKVYMSHSFFSQRTSVSFSPRTQSSNGAWNWPSQIQGRKLLKKWPLSKTDRSSCSFNWKSHTERIFSR